MKSVYKLITLGDLSVGKTSIVESYINGKFNQVVEPTLGACFYKKDITHNQKTYSFEVTQRTRRSGTPQDRRGTSHSSSSTTATQT